MEKLDFGFLNSHDTIVVTGPQRSGTRITARMIGADTRRYVVDENHYKKMEEAFAHPEERKVIHAPRFTHVCHTWGQDVLVVFCMRNVADIMRSQKRISWGYNTEEVRKYEEAGLSKYHAQDLINACEIKYAVWHNYQKVRCAAYYESWYDNLISHSMYVDKDTRWWFKPTQTSPNA